MAATSAEDAVRNYLAALKDPAALRDDDQISTIRAQLESSGDELERLRLRQQLHNAENPRLDTFEDDFVTHARAWAEEQGIEGRAFAEEGVPDGVLRRAGLSSGRRGRRAGRRAGGTTRTRVTADEVRAAIPRGTFTTKTLQEKSGASPAVVRKVIAEEEQAGHLTNQGPDPDHRGPGRAPTLYKKAT
jgi:hypothetical protein